MDIIEIITGTADSLPEGMLVVLARYRHRVFVERMGWKLPSMHRMELDQFDRADTHYVVALKPTGELVGTGRLLPTDRPYLLGEVFPQLLGSTPPPNSPDVWELSRFAAVDLSAARSSGASSPFHGALAPVTR